MIPIIFALLLGTVQAQSPGKLCTGDCLKACVQLAIDGSCEQVFPGAGPLAPISDPGALRDPLPSVPGKVLTPVERMKVGPGANDFPFKDLDAGKDGRISPADDEFLKHFVDNGIVEVSATPNEADGELDHFNLKYKDGRTVGLRLSDVPVRKEGREKSGMNTFGFIDGYVKRRGTIFPVFDKKLRFDEKLTPRVVDFATHLHWVAMARKQMLEMAELTNAFASQIALSAGMLGTIHSPPTWERTGFKPLRFAKIEDIGQIRGSPPRAAATLADHVVYRDVGGVNEVAATSPNPKTTAIIPSLEIKGAHNLTEFESHSAEYIVERVEPHPTAPGISRHFYRMRQIGSDGQPTAMPKAGAPEPKTTYDPRVISDAQYLQLGIEAAYNAWESNNYELPDYWEGTASGIRFGGRAKNGEVTTFYPIW